MANQLSRAIERKRFRVNRQQNNQGWLSKTKHKNLGKTWADCCFEVSLFLSARMDLWLRAVQEAPPQGQRLSAIRARELTATYARHHSTRRTLRLFSEAAEDHPGGEQQAAAAAEAD